MSERIKDPTELNHPDNLPHMADSVATVLYAMLSRGNIHVGSSDPVSLALWMGLGQLTLDYINTRDKKLAADALADEPSEDDEPLKKVTIQ